MGCGCKNNQNQTQQVQPATAQQIEKAKQMANESIKNTIKKTVEKYYQVEKKTNGWVKE